MATFSCRSMAEAKSIYSNSAGLLQNVNVYTCLHMAKSGVHVTSESKTGGFLGS